MSIHLIRYLITEFRENFLKGDLEIVLDIKPFFDVTDTMYDCCMRLVEELCDFRQALCGELSRNIHRELARRDD